MNKQHHLRLFSSSAEADRVRVEIHVLTLNQSTLNRKFRNCCAIVTPRIHHEYWRSRIQDLITVTPEQFLNSRIHRPTLFLALDLDTTTRSQVQEFANSRRFHVEVYS